MAEAREYDIPIRLADLALCEMKEALNRGCPAVSVP